MTKYEFSYGIGFANATRTEIVDIAEYLGMTQAEFDAMTEQERQTEIQGAFDDWANNFIDAAFWEVE